MSDVNQIAISADGQDITITIGDYSDANARAAISVVDAGGDGSLAYTTATGVITYTGPSASEVRAHFTAGTGISIASGVITNTSLNTNTTYTVSAEDGTTGKKIIRLTGSDASTDDVTLVQGSNVTLTRAGDEITIASSYTDTNTTYTQGVTSTTGGANLNLVGTDSTTDPVKFASGTNVTVTRTDDSTITIASTDTNTTYGISAETATGGANLRLTDSSAGTDNVKFASGTGMTVSRTDADTINIATTITQYTDALARQSISVATNTGDGDLTYNNTNGQFSYTGPGNTEYRAAVSAANSGTGYGSLAYDSGTGAFTYTKVTGANIRSEVVDGRNLTYTSSTLDLDKTLVSVNSVTAETATNLTLTGDELVINTVDVDNASQFLNLNSPGYTYDLPLNTFNVTNNFTVSNFGTTSATFNHYVIFADVTSGSNLLTNTTVLSLRGDEAIDLSTVTDLVGLPILDGDQGYFDLGVVIQSISNIQGTYDPDPGINTQTATLTLTVKDSAIATTANCQMPTEPQVPLDAVHYIRNSTATNVVFTGKNSTTGVWDLVGLYRDASNNGLQDGADIAVTYVSYDYTGTQDFQITPRRVLKLQPKNAINEHVNVPFGLGVGPGAISTDRGLERASFDTVGINIQNNGKLIGYASPTGITLTQFKDNSYFNSGLLAERCGPTFTFNSFAGNSDTPTPQLNLSNGDGIGQIKFYATNTSGTLVSFASPPAGIIAKATEDHDSTTKQGVGLYLQYSPNSQTSAARPKTFLRAEDVTTELLAKTTLKLGKITTSTASSSAQVSTAAARTWVTIDDSGLSLNGSTSGSVELAASATGDQLNLLDSASVALVGNKINYNRVYGQWQYNTSITGLTADTAYKFPIGTADFNNIASVGSTSRIILGAAGMYNLQFSVQLANTDNAEHTAYIWLVKNGTPVAASTGRITVVKSGSTIAGWNYLIDSANTTDYYELGYAVSNSALTFVNYASTAFAPSTATLITTVTPVGA